MRPHENVAKYFGTPHCFTLPRYLALKMTSPLDTIQKAVKLLGVSENDLNMMNEDEREKYEQVRNAGRERK